MADAEWLGKLLSAFGLPVAGWATFCLVAVHYFRAHNERRRDIDKAKDGDWRRLREEIRRLDERCDHLQEEVDECRQREGEWMNRAISAEAALLGQGEALQKAQRIVSSERQADAAAREAAAKKPDES